MHASRQHRSTLPIAWSFPILTAKSCSPLGSIGYATLLAGCLANNCGLMCSTHQHLPAHRLGNTCASLQGGPDISCLIFTAALRADLLAQDLC